MILHRVFKIIYSKRIRRVSRKISAVEIQHREQTTKLFRTVARQLLHVYAFARADFMNKCP